MKPLLALSLLSLVAPAAQASLVLIYLGLGEVYVATDSAPRAGECAVPQTVHGLRMVSLGIGPAFDIELDDAQAAAATVAPGKSAPSEAAMLHGTLAAQRLRPVWQNKKANILAGLERSGFQGEVPALHQFCFLGLNAGKHLELACGAVVPQGSNDLTVEMQPARVVSYDQGGELVAFGLTQGMPKPQAVAKQIEKQGPAKALKRLVTGQAHLQQLAGSAASEPVTVVHFSSLGDYQWESGAACAQDKTYGSLRQPKSEPRNAIVAANE